MTGAKLFGKIRPTSLLALMMVFTLSANVMANDEEVLKSDPINIEGYVKGEPEPTDHELVSITNELKKQKDAIKINKKKAKTYQKLQRSTEKLAEETEEYLTERAESQKVIDAYNKKIKCLMEKQNPKLCKEGGVQDQVAVSAAAPARSEAKVEKATSAGKFELEKIKLLPYTGMTMFNTDSGQQLDSNLTAGIRAEVNVGEKLSFGLGYAYTTMETTDICFYGPECLGIYSSEVEYKRHGLEAYGKFFFTNAQRFRPYVGAGLSYARSTMNYAQVNTGSIYTRALATSQELESTIVGAALSVGSEIKFTQSIGMNLELAYSTALSNNNNNNNPFNNYIPGQLRLQRLSQELEEGDAVSLLLGLLVSF